MLVRAPQRNRIGTIPLAISTAREVLRHWQMQWLEAGESQMGKTRPSGWRPRKEFMFQFESEDSLPADFPLSQEQQDVVEEDVRFCFSSYGFQLIE